MGLEKLILLQRRKKSRQPFDNDEGNLSGDVNFCLMEKLQLGFTCIIIRDD